MCKVYKITNKVNNKFYIGISNNVKKRWNSHKYFSTKGTNHPLYNALRKYGFDKFKIETLYTFKSRQEACEKEIELIQKLSPHYNIAKGGEGGFTIVDIDSWKSKLRLARIGRKPALGMKHTEETKRKCSEAAKRKVLLYPEINTELSFKEAKEKYGISKTHFYRLKRSKSSDL